jgi:hypothetical protein
MDDLLKQLNAAGVRYLLIGGQAMRLMGMPRFSMDWDFFLPGRDEPNLERLNQLLEDDLDAPVLPLGPRGENFLQTYQTRWGIIQFHLGLPGVPHFDEAEAAAAPLYTGCGTPVRCLSGRHLLAAKQAANRPQDQVDIEFLLELQRAGKL